MKKYALLNKDLSVLANEVDSYLLANGADSPSYVLQLYHTIGTTEDLVDSIPSLADAFTDEGLTITGIGHWRVDNVIRGIPASLSLLIVPLKNTENSTFHVMDLKPDARPYTEYSLNHDYYDSRDCTSLESFEITSPIFVCEDTLHAIENSDNDLAEFIIIAFNEDTSSYFAE